MSRCVSLMKVCGTVSDVVSQLLALRFSKDQRVTEVHRLLVSSQPVRIAIAQRPEVRSASAAAFARVRTIVVGESSSSIVAAIGENNSNCSMDYHPSPSHYCYAIYCLVINSL